MLDSKSLLAKLMATENLKIEQRNVRTASFDTKNRILTIPTLDGNLSSTIYDLFMGHEVGHALYTPNDEWINSIKVQKLPKSVLNVVEDARIERKIKNKYPGLRNSFVKAYNELVAKDFFGTAGGDLNDLNFIDRVNMHMKGGAQLNIQFDAEERVLLDKVNSTETYDDVINVTIEVCDFMKARKEEEKKSLPKYEEDEEESEFEDLDEDEFDDNPADEEDGEDGENGEEEGEEEEGESENQKQSSNGSDYDDDIKSQTDENFKENESKLFAEKSENYLYLNVPKVDIEKCVVPYKKLWALQKQEVGERFCAPSYMEYYTKVRNETNKVVTYLAKEFEMRKNAQQMKRASTSKTGELNMSKVFSYQINEDIFKKLTIVPDGKSHGLVLFLDWSGSMVDHLESTLKQLLALMLFCKKVSIPFEVYAFADSGQFDMYNNDLRTYRQTVQDSNADDVKFENLLLLNMFSSKMSSMEFTYAACNLFNNGTHRVMPLNSTPLNQAIVAAMDIVPEFKKKYKLQIVNTVFLSDGESNTTCEYIFQRGDGTKTSSSIPSKTQIVLTDPVTKFQEFCVVGWENRSSMTNALIKLLRQRTQSNVIGFYLLSSKEFKRYGLRLFPKGFNIDSVKEKFLKDKNLVISNGGYNEYYLLRSEKNVSEAVSEFEVKSTTTRGLVSAFSKYANSKLTNKVILNRFIGLVS